MAVEEKTLELISEINEIFSNISVHAEHGGSFNLEGYVYSSFNVPLVMFI